jgi:hypothetical protein
MTVSVTVADASKLALAIYRESVTLRRSGKALPSIRTTVASNVYVSYRLVYAGRVNAALRTVKARCSR